MKKAIRISIMLLFSALLFSCPISGGGSSKKSGEGSTPTTPGGEDSSEIPEVPEVPETGPAITLNVVGDFESGNRLDLHIFTSDEIGDPVYVSEYSTSYSNNKKSYKIGVKETDKNKGYFVYSLLTDTNNIILAANISNSSDVDSIKLTNSRPMISTSPYAQGEYITQINTVEEFKVFITDGYDGLAPISFASQRTKKFGSYSYTSKKLSATLESVTGPSTPNLVSNLVDTTMSNDGRLSFIYTFKTDLPGVYYINVNFDDGNTFRSKSIPITVIGSGQGGVDVTID